MRLHHHQEEGHHHAPEGPISPDDQARRQEGSEGFEVLLILELDKVGRIDGSIERGVCVCGGGGGSIAGSSQRG